MALSNRDRIGKALDQLRDGLLPYLSRELYQGLGTNWQDNLPPNANNLQDVSVLLGLFMEHWGGIFKRLLSQSDRAYVSELKEARAYNGLVIAWPELERLASASSSSKSAPRQTTLI